MSNNENIGNLIVDFLLNIYNNENTSDDIRDLIVDKLMENIENDATTNEEDETPNEKMDDEVPAENELPTV